MAQRPRRSRCRLARCRSDPARSALRRVLVLSVPTRLHVVPFFLAREVPIFLVEPLCTCILLRSHEVPTLNIHGQSQARPVASLSRIASTCRGRPSIRLRTTVLPDACTAWMSRSTTSMRSAYPRTRG